MKTTKKYISSVADTIQYQKTFIKDVTIKGADNLADVDKKQNELILTLKRDTTKADKKDTYTKREVDSIINNLRKEFSKEK